MATNAPLPEILSLTKTWLNFGKQPMHRSSKPNIFALLSSSNATIKSTPQKTMLGAINRIDVMSYMQEVHPLWRLYHLSAYIKPTAEKWSFFRNMIIAESQSLLEKNVKFFKETADYPFLQWCCKAMNISHLAFTAGVKYC